MQAMRSLAVGQQTCGQRSFDEQCVAAANALPCDYVVIDASDIRLGANLQQTGGTAELLVRPIAERRFCEFADNQTNIMFSNSNICIMILQPFGSTIGAVTNVSICVRNLSMSRFVSASLHRRSHNARQI